MSLNRPLFIVPHSEAILALGQKMQAEHAKTGLNLNRLDQEHVFSDNVTRPRQFSKRKKLPIREMNEREIQDLVERRQRGTHFPANPKPSDHIAFLHCDYMHDTTKALRSFFGLRRLGAIENRNKTSLYDSYASKTSVEMGLQHINELVGEEKVYATQSTFKWGWFGDKDRHRCSRKYLTSISTLFVDVDIYADNSALSRLSKQQAADAILARLDEHNIPHPVIIDSGRGFYLDWALGERLSLRRAVNFELWQKVQVKLIELFSDFGADAKVKDLTRVLRLIGTVNEKNGNTVKVINDDGAYYSLKTLEKSVKHLDTPEGWIPKIVNPTKSQKNRFKKVIERTKVKSKIGNVAKGKALGKLASEPLRAIYNNQENNWTVDPVDLKAFNQFIDQMRVDFERKNITTQQSLTYRYFRFFIDIAKLAQLRGGIKKGYRNNFVFWSVSLLYNARLITLENLPLVCRNLQLICEDKYDVLASGSLSTLQEKIEIDEDSRTKDSACAPSAFKVVKSGGFRCVVPVGSKEMKRAAQSTTWVSVKHGSNSFRGMGRETYTPSVAYLIHHFGITPDEQLHMQTLTDEVEKSRRRSLNNKSYQLASRNRAIAKAVTAGMRADSAAVKFNVSLATVYRAVDKVAKEDAQVVVPDVSVDDNELMLEMGGFYRKTSFRPKVKSKSKSTPEKTAAKVNNTFFNNDSHFLSASKEGDTQKNIQDIAEERERLEERKKKEEKREKSPICHASSSVPARKFLFAPTSSLLAVTTRGVPVFNPTVVISADSYVRRLNQSERGAQPVTRVSTKPPTGVRGITVKSSGASMVYAPPPLTTMSVGDMDVELKGLLSDLVLKRKQLESLDLSRIDYLKSKSSQRETSKALSLLDLANASFYESIQTHSPDLKSLHSLLVETQRDTVAIVKSELGLLSDTLYSMNALNSMNYPVGLRTERIAALVDQVQYLRDGVSSPSSQAQSLRSTTARYIDRFLDSIDQNILSVKQTQQIDASFNELVNAIQEESNWLQKELMVC